MITVGQEFQKFACHPFPDLESELALTNWVGERKFPPDGDWRHKDWNQRGNLADLLPWFKDWIFDWLNTPGLIRDAQSFYEYPMVDRDPLKLWSHGRMTLLGDAAHPMHTIASNGASQAILDTEVLTRKIQSQRHIPMALLAYEAEHRSDTSKIVLANHDNGPEQVMQMVKERPPDSYARIEEVLSAAGR
jgi:2-polyprenyl-6-methoxyphenol hydroxylase-like FAD-dependent oxidoreductase